MAGNPILGFLQAQPVGDDARSTVTKMLRLLGIVVLAGFVVSVLNGVLTIAMGADYAGSTALATTTAVTGIVVSLVITGLVCWWVTLATQAWSAGQPSGATHALVLGILAAVFGAIGVLAGLAGIGGTALFGSGVPVLFTVVNAASLVASLGELVCGILILVNRGKAMGAASGSAHPARN